MLAFYHDILFMLNEYISKYLYFYVGFHPALIFERSEDILKTEGFYKLLADTDKLYI